MPCDTPPPPAAIEDNIANDEDPDDFMYEVIDMDELEGMPDDADDADDDEQHDAHDDAIVTFEGHSDSVFCCNFNSTGELIVSGGQDDKAFVWSASNSTVKFECTDHTDSVIAASFSSDSRYVSTADMNGLIQVWDVNNGSLVFSFETEEVIWSEWLHDSNFLLVGSADGNCWKFDVVEETSSIFEHAHAGCNAGCISCKDERLVTGYQDGTLKLWDIPNHKLLCTLTGGSGGHSKNVTSIKFSLCETLIATASEDGTSKIIKASDFKVLWTIDCDSSHSDASVESVGFCDGLTYYVTGTNCGCICTWDLNRKTMRNKVDVGTPVIKIICDAVHPVFYVALENGTVRAYDARNHNILKQWEGHRAAIFDFAISRDYNWFVTGSEDHTLKIFERDLVF